MSAVPDVPVPTPEAWQQIVFMVYSCTVQAQQNYIRAWGTRNGAYCDGMADGMVLLARLLGVSVPPRPHFDPSWLDDQEGAVARWRASVGLPPEAREDAGDAPTTDSW